MACADLVSGGRAGRDGAQSGARRSRDLSPRLPRAVPVRCRPSAARRAKCGSTALPRRLDEARARVQEAAAFAAGVPLTGFSLADLLALAGGDHLALADLARALRADGLEASPKLPLDRLGDTENTLEVVRAATRGGLGVWRAVGRSRRARRPARSHRARGQAVQRETGALTRVRAAGAHSTRKTRPRPATTT